MMQACSPARNNALPDGTNMPKLPLEVIQLILTVGLPPRRSNNDPSRFAFLLPRCLVHPALTRSIQRLLFANILLIRMESIRRFLDSLELVPEFRRWVKTLVWYDGGTGNVAEANDALSIVVKHCIEMEEVELIDVGSVNLALFAQLKHLRSLECYGRDMTGFEPIVGKLRPFESLVSLSFFGGGRIPSSGPSFFVPEVLPSLRRLLIDCEGDEGPIDSITDLYGIASQLHHLSLERLEERLDPLLDKCTNLSSLRVSVHNIVSSPRRLSKPLVGLRLRPLPFPEDEESFEVMELLEGALSSGLISASADSRTVIFLSGNKKHSPAAADFAEWAESVGLALEYKDGALQQKWSSDNLDDGYSEFTNWVDEAARREAVAAERKIRQ